MASGGATPSAGLSAGPGAGRLQAMPAGTVQLQPDSQGHLRAHVNLFGLTPGSVHDLSIDSPAYSAPAVQFPAFTADVGGQADTTVTSADGGAPLPPLSRLIVRLGSKTTSPGSELAGEPIAETGILPAHPGLFGEFAFRAVTATGAGLARPAGRATVTFTPAGRTLTVTVTASGLTPGPHAAHIHQGSCQAQGPVAYMLPDFTADQDGNIINQSRQVTVSGGPAPGTWYFNLHLGGMNDILANGTPTLAFRPLLCAGVTTAGGTPSAAPSPPAASTPGMTIPTGTPASGPGMTMPASSPTPAGTHF